MNKDEIFKETNDLVEKILEEKWGPLEDKIINEVAKFAEEKKFSDAVVTETILTISLNISQRLFGHSIICTSLFSDEYISVANRFIDIQSEILTKTLDNIIKNLKSNLH